MGKIKGPFGRNGQPIYPSGITLGQIEEMKEEFIDWNRIEKRVN